MTMQGTQPPSSDQKSGASDSASSSVKEKGVHASRRKLITGLAATPVIMTLASRPALARNFCSISGWGSVHPSGRPEGQICLGRSPGFWGTYWSGPSAGAWAESGFNQGPTNLLTSSTKSDDYSIPTLLELSQAVTDGIVTQAEVDTYIAALLSTDTFDDLMGPINSALSATLPDNIGKPITRPTIMQILWEQNGDYATPNNAAFHYAASLLNAAAWGEADYGYSLDQMRNLINAKDGTVGFIEDLQGLYDR
jgi:hypothetical protein